MYRAVPFVVVCVAVFDSVGDVDGNDAPYSFSRHRVLRNEYPMILNDEEANPYHCGVDDFGYPSRAEDDDVDGGVGWFGFAALAHHHGPFVPRLEHGGGGDDHVYFDLLVDICEYGVAPLELDEDLPMVLVLVS